MLTPNAAHMPPFTFVTASGHVKQSGSDPPALAGRKQTLATVTLGNFFTKKGDLLI